MSSSFGWAARPGRASAGIGWIVGPLGARDWGSEPQEAANALVRRVRDRLVPRGERGDLAGLSVRPATRAEPVASTDRRVLRRVHRVDAAHPFGRDRPAHRATLVRTGIHCTRSHLVSLSHIPRGRSLVRGPRTGWARAASSTSAVTSPLEGGTLVGTHHQCRPCLND